MPVPKKGSPEAKAWAAQMAARRAAKQAPQTNTPQTTQNNQSVMLSPEQFDELISRLSAGTVIDKAPAPSMAGNGLQTNALGQVVGTFKKFNIDPSYYPNPVEALLEFCDANTRMRRHNVRENYFIEWEITSKPYETKDHINVQEPTFHLTLYANEYDDQGEDTDRFIVIQTLHMNEDEEIALLFATDQGLDTDNLDMKSLMDKARFERARRWLVDIFYPPRLFDLNEDSREEAIGGSVVKVITKSNVKGFGNKAPTIADEELS